MADIEVTVGYEDLHTLKRLLNDDIPKSAKTSAAVFEREYKSVEREFKRASTSAQGYYKELLGLENSTKSAKQSASVFAPVIKAMDQDFKMAMASAEEYNRSLLGFSTTNKTAKDSASVFKLELEKQDQALKENSRVIKEEAATLEALRMKYQPLYAASRLYEKELEGLTLATQKKIITDEQHRQALDRLNQEYSEFNAGTAAFSNRFVQGNVRSKRSLNDLGVAVQQTGYQVGDFLVQVQSGTNWMVAFGQQATQLVGILPMLSSSIGVSAGMLVAISSGLGIAIPLVTALGAAWMRTRKENDKASESLKTLDDELKSIDQTLKTWVNTKKAAEAGLTVEEMFGVQGLEKAEKELKDAQDAYKELRSQLDDSVPVIFEGVANNPKLEKEALEVLNSLTTLQDKVTAAEERYQNLLAKRAENQKKTYDERLRGLSNELSIQHKINMFGEKSLEVEAEKLRQAIESEKADIRKLGLQSEQEKMLIALVDKMYELQKSNSDAANEASRLTRELEKAASAMRSLKSFGAGLDQTIAVVTAEIGALEKGTDSQIAGRIEQFRQEAKELRDAAIAAGADPVKVSAEFGIDNAVISNLEAQLKRKKELEDQARKTTSSSGGGDSGDSGFLGFARGLAGSDQQAAIDAWRMESLEKLASFNTQELELLGGHEQAKLLIQEEYLRRTRELEGSLRREKLDGYQTMFSDLTALMTTGNAKLFKIGQAAAIANATVDGYEAATAAWKWGMAAGGIPLATAATAASLAKTGSLIASIASASPSGGSSGGGSISTSAVASSESITPQRVLVEGLSPDSIITGQMLSDMFDQLYKENDRRGGVFQVAFS